MLNSILDALNKKGARNPLASATERKTYPGKVASCADLAYAARA